MARNNKQTAEESIYKRCGTPGCSSTTRIVTDGGEPTDNSEKNARDDPPSIAPLWPVIGYQTEVDRSETALTTYEGSPGNTPLGELQSMCVCEGRWVEYLAALSSAVRHSDYDHPDDELWVIATMTQLEVHHERQVRVELFEGDLVRVEDLPDTVDIPEYDRPFNYRPSEIDEGSDGDHPPAGGEK